MASPESSSQEDQVNLQFQSTVNKWKDMIDHSIVSSQHLLSSFSSSRNNSDFIMEILARLLCEAREPDSPELQKHMYTELRRVICRYTQKPEVPEENSERCLSILTMFKDLMERSKLLSTTNINPSLLRCSSQVEDFLLHHQYLLNQSMVECEDRFNKDFIQEAVIGRGGFGTVVRARHIIDRCNYAIKIIAIQNDDCATRLMREAQALASLDHPNIVRYYNAWLQPLSPLLGNQVDPDFDESSSNSSNNSSGRLKEFLQCDEQSSSNIFNFQKLQIEEFKSNDSFIVFDHSNSEISESSSSEFLKSNGAMMPFSSKSTVKQNLFIQMSLCGISLKSFLKNRNDKCTSTNWEIIDTTLNLQFFFDILLALNYIHRKGIIHRDLKPANILLSIDGERALLSDFGLVGQDITISKHSLLNVRRYGTVGTPPYTAPEVAKGICDMKNDLYGLGIILYELFHPFNTQSERVYSIQELKSKRRVHHEVTRRWPEMAKLIISLTEEPHKRPTAAEVLHAIQHIILDSSINTDCSSLHPQNIQMFVGSDSKLRSASSLLKLDIPEEIQDFCNYKCNIRKETQNSNSSSISSNEFIDPEVNSFAMSINSEKSMEVLEEKKKLLLEQLSCIDKRLYELKKVSE